jgi:Thermolysin metallopeptidase, alpha-helical domain
MAGFIRLLMLAVLVALVAAPAANAQTRTLLRVWDASAGAEPIGGWKGYAQVRVTGDPRTARWPAWQSTLLPGVTRSAKMDALVANAENVARTICVVRGYCGKWGDSRSPWDVLGNDPDVDGARADRRLQYVTVGDEHILLGGGDPNQPYPDVIAHEFGHIMDAEYAGDRASSQNLEGDAVEEALADMFAFDYDRENATIGEDSTGGAMRNWANPNAIKRDGQPYPDHMSDYDSTPPDDSPHYNSTILSHAYYRFVQLVGHSKAGRVLHNVPQRLAPKPTFRQLQRAFSQSAYSIYGGTVSAHARTAFTAVGLAPPPHEEPDCGPEAC